MKSYRELEVWQLAMQFAVDVYDYTKSFPSDERFALANQLHRAAVSIPSNIAEGFGRDTTKDLLHFLVLARGSLFEVQTQLELSLRLHYSSSISKLLATSERIGMMLNALAAKLKTRLNN